MKVLDLHLHPSLKPYNNNGYRRNEELNIWENVLEIKEHFKSLPRMIRMTFNETQRDSQSNLNRFLPGKTSLGFFSLHPVERGWYDLEARKRRSIRRFLLDLFLRPSHYPHLAASMSGLPYIKVLKILSRVKDGRGIDYYEKETFKEYLYIVEQSKTTGADGARFEIVSDFGHYQQVLQKKNTFGAVFSVEGGHALTNLKYNEWLYKPYEKMEPHEQVELRSATLRNVLRLKGQSPSDVFNFDPDHTPFFVTFCHMFNNFLCGHAKTFGDGKFVLPGMSDLLHQETSMNNGITPLGWEVLQSLLSRENGRRILIDVKHMSMRSRGQYYEYVANLRMEGEQVPIICSHGAANGYETNYLNRLDRNRLNKGEYFSRWSINLSNEDIRAIFESDGIIGIVPHEGRMPGSRLKKQFRKLKKKNKSRELKSEYNKLIWSNIFQMVAAVNQKQAWDMICLGSDYDGMMDPFNGYEKQDDLLVLASDLAEYLDKKPRISIYRDGLLIELELKEIRDLMFHFTAEELVEKIFSANLENFLSKYFTKGYLEKEKQENIMA